MKHYKYNCPRQIGKTTYAIYLAETFGGVIIVQTKIQKQLILKNNPDLNVMMSSEVTKTNISEYDVVVLDDVRDGSNRTKTICFSNPELLIDLYTDSESEEMHYELVALKEKGDKLKTIDDLWCGCESIMAHTTQICLSDPSVDLDELRDEAIKHIKKLREDGHRAQIPKILGDMPEVKWIKHFFNIAEEDLE